MKWLLVILILALMVIGIFVLPVPALSGENIYAGGIFLIIIVIIIVIVLLYNKIRFNP